MIEWCGFQSDKSAVSYEFKLSSDKMAKRLWKIAVEHHTFFRSAFTASFSAGASRCESGCIYALRLVFLSFLSIAFLISSISYYLTSFHLDQRSLLNTNWKSYPASQTELSLRVKADVVLTCTNRISPIHLPVIVASDRP